MSKGPEAFRTISEVAEELALPQHVLRFWETRFTSIKPMKRGGGRRYYRPDDVDLLRGIRALLYGEGYTIRGVQRILKEQGPRSIISAARGGSPPVPAAPRPPAAALPRVDIPLPIPRLAPAIDLDDPLDDGIGDGPVPAFDVREFRAPPAVAMRPPALPASLTLSAEDVRRLHATLVSLLELKRLLDASRD